MFGVVFPGNPPYEGPIVVEGRHLQGHANLKRQAMGGAAWSLARFGSEQVFRFFVFAFLARILSPRDFGIFALATIFVDIGRILASSGMAEAMIRSEKADDELANTLFWLAVGRGLTVAVGLGLLAIPIAAILKQPVAAPVIMALGACLLFEPLSLVHNSRATRAFKNKALTAIALTANFTSGASAVIAALSGLGLWSFVVSQVVYGVIGTSLAWMTFPWMPKLGGFSRARLKEVVKFSGNMMLAQLLGVSVSRAQDFFAGRFLGAASVGQLRVAGRVFDVINQAMIVPLAAVALPTLSRLQDNDQRFRNAYSRMLSLSAMVACPAALGFSAVAADAIPLLFGQQWTPAVPVVQVAGLLAPISVLTFFSGPALTALGRADTVVRFAVLQLVAVTAVALVSVRFGLVALAAAQVARAYLLIPLQLWLFTKATGMSGWSVLRNVVPPAAAALIMAAALHLLAPGLRGWIAEPIPRLAVAVPLGVVIYFGVLLLFWRRFVFNQIEGVRSALSGEGAG